MNLEIRIESNEEVEKMQCLEVKELFGQLKSHKIKCCDLSFHILISINRVVISTFKKENFG